MSSDEPNLICNMQCPSGCKYVLVGMLVVLGCFCLVIGVLILTQFHCHAVTPPTESISWNSMKHVINIDNVNGSSTQILRTFVDRQRQKIRDDLRDHQYPHGKKLGNLVLEEDGRPIRNIILTTWRTGSTFLAEALETHPATIYFYEPLTDFDNVQIRSPPMATRALERIRALFNCDFAKLDEYMKFIQINEWAFRCYDQNLRNNCQDHRELCYDQKYLTAMCKLFPFQLSKIIRLDLNIAQELMADESLSVRMVLLVRDPRAIIKSRKHHVFCPKNRDCSDPAILCADMASNHKIARELVKKYPTAFKILRYEDLAAAPYERMEELVRFYGMNFHKNIKEFLDTHTTRDDGGKYETYRDIKKVPFHWKEELQFEEVEEIQRSCAIAMENWGYVPAINATHQQEFYPVTSYDIN